LRQTVGGLQLRPILLWVVIEVHCYLKPAGQVSVWISGRPLSDDKSLAEDVAVRLVGPVSGAEGERVAAILEEQLTAAGVTVIRSAAADD
jgi:hypothetical protein